LGTNPQEEHVGTRFAWYPYLLIELLGGVQQNKQKPSLVGTGKQGERRGGKETTAQKSQVDMEPTHKRTATKPLVYNLEWARNRIQDPGGLLLVRVAENFYPSP